MKYISMVAKNLYYYKYHPFLFLLFLLAQIVCCIAVFISCGMTYNMDYIEKDTEQYKWYGFVFDAPKGIGIIIKEDENGNTIRTALFTDNDGNPTEELELTNAIELKNFREPMERFISETKDYNLSSVEYEIYSSKTLKSDKVQIDMFESIYPGLDPVYPIDEKFISSKDKIILGPLYDNKGQISKITPLRLGEKIQLGGEDFNCAGVYKYYFIPYAALPDSFVIGVMRVRFDNLMTAQDINSVIGIANDIFGSNITETYSPTPYNPDSVKFTKMMYIISLIVMLIVLLAIAKYYSFILETRRSNLAILRLCGCSREASHIIYLSEMMLTMLVTSAVGYAVFRYVLLEPIAEMYPSFTEFYSGKAFLIILLAYFLIAGIIMTVTVRISTRSSIEEMRKQ